MRKKRIGIVADDVTGANDIGVMFGNGGYRSAVFPLNLIGKCDFQRESEGLDCVIIDTDSRFDTPEAAADKVEEATRLLQTIHCDRYFNKTCSVFRGNIGAEFDRMQDVLGVSCSMVIAGFPKNGRTTVDGIHYVYGTRLEDSQFRTDPIHPMTTSFLPDIMRRQTERNIGQITWRDLDQGFSHVMEVKEELKRSCAYVLFDIRHQEDLKLVARATADELNLCGSSAIGEELPAAYGAVFPEEAEAVLLISGSLTVQTIAQTEYLRRKGCPMIELKTDFLFEDNAVEEEERIIAEALAAMREGGTVLIHSPQSQEKAEALRENGKGLGFSREEIGKRISGCLCGAAREVLRQSGCRLLVVAGGDTSAAAAGKLGIYRMEIGEEIEPGVPVMTGRTDLGEMRLVLKSGSFGSEEFLERAVEALRGM